MKTYVPQLIDDKTSLVGDSDLPVILKPNVATGPHLHNVARDQGYTLLYSEEEIAKLISHTY